MLGILYVRILAVINNNNNDVIHNIINPNLSNLILFESVGLLLVYI